MCGGFYCSRNSLILLNLMYIVSLTFSRRFEIDFVRSWIIDCVKNLEIAGCWWSTNWLCSVWKSIHRFADNSIRNKLWNCFDFAGSVWSVRSDEAPSSRFVLLHDHPLLLVYRSICHRMLVLGCEQTSAAALC